MMTMKKNRITVLFLVLSLLLSGCAGKGSEPSARKYQTTFLDLFDTVTTILGYAESEEEFLAEADRIHDSLMEYHQLFDIYNDYPGMNNLKTVNDRAGTAPVTVDRRIIDLLLLCREFYEASGGRENAAMGSVLRLWHDAREYGTEHPDEAALPDQELLCAAAEHTGFEDVVIDEQALTVSFADAALRLDVGSVAKGFAVTAVCRSVPSGYLISVGGNVIATGPKASGASWVVGITDPDGGADIHTFSVEHGSVVTSGDYQRCYTVDGKSYRVVKDFRGIKQKSVTGLPNRIPTSASEDEKGWLNISHGSVVNYDAVGKGLWPIGSETTVYYDPEKPKRSYVERPITTDFFTTMAVIFGSAALAGGVLAFILTNFAG